jgi:hypothetical protein
MLRLALRPTVNLAYHKPVRSQVGDCGPLAAQTRVEINLVGA